MKNKKTQNLKLLLNSKTPTVTEGPGIEESISSVVIIGKTGY